MNSADQIFNRMFELQQQLVRQFGNVDLYRSEEHRGILIVRAGMPLVPQNVISMITEQ